jgi:cyclin-dependent kinase 8/11
VKGTKKERDLVGGRSAAMGDGRAGASNRPAWLQQYDLIGKIGEGTYGLVFLARLKPTHPQAAGRRGSPIAIKKFKQSKEGDGVSPTAIREIMVVSSHRCRLLHSFLRSSSYQTLATYRNVIFSHCVCHFWFQLLREINHENVVKLVNVHINHADMSLYLAFDYAEHDLYVCNSPSHAYMHISIPVNLLV